MNALTLAFQALSLVNTAVGAVLAHRQGGTDDALAVLAAVDPVALGLPPEVAQAVKLAQAGVAYLEARGTARDAAFALIRAHRESGVPLTPDGAEMYLSTQVDPVLDGLRQAIAEAKAAGH